jgi:hypothetical protein
MDLVTGKLDVRQSGASLPEELEQVIPDEAEDILGEEDTSDDSDDSPEEAAA